VSDIDVRVLLHLARAELEDAPSELRQLYQWKFDHMSTAAKGIVWAGASVLVAVVLGTVEHKGHSSWWPIGLGFVSAFIVLTVGAFRYAQVRNVYREYVEAQDLLSEALKMSSFLRLYRPPS